jgi:hypothetical protein
MLPASRAELLLAKFYYSPAYLVKAWLYETAFLDPEPIVGIPLDLLTRLFLSKACP